MQAIKRLEALPALSKFNSTRSVSTRVPNGLPLWTFFRRVPAQNRASLQDAPIANEKQIPIPTILPPLRDFFPGTTWSPLLTAALEVARDFTIAYLTMRLLRYAIKKINEGAWIGELDLDGGIRRSRDVFGAITRAASKPLSVTLFGAAVWHSLQVAVYRIDQLFNLTAASKAGTLNKIADWVVDVSLKNVLSPVDGIIETVLELVLLLAVYGP